MKNIMRSGVGWRAGFGLRMGFVLSAGFGLCMGFGWHVGFDMCAGLDMKEQSVNILAGILIEIVASNQTSLWLVFWATICVSVLFHNLLPHKGAQVCGGPHKVDPTNVPNNIRRISKINYNKKRGGIVDFIVATASLIEIHAICIFYFCLSFVWSSCN